MEKIWVSQDWYIPVDEYGYINGPCFEGMLGCVLQLEHGKSKSKAAMKIPRLLADTVEENAYICKMTQEEEAAVIEINTLGGSSAGLLAAQYFESNPLIRRRSTKNSFNSDARKQHDHVIFVSFERDRKPRFCSANLIEQGFSVFPRGCKADFEKSITVADWNHFIERTREQQLPDFSRTMYKLQASERRKQGDLIDALNTQETSHVWYAAIPSMIFDWAQEDLQEAIAKQEIKSWSLNQHFTLFEQVLRGIVFLHSHNMIHGDIRPANVMRIGPQEPEKYRLGDYGSYGREWQAIADSESPSGLTKVGPAIGRQRQTPFYSPERRAGFEFESANVAIIKKLELERSSKGHDYILILGWRSEVLLADGAVSDATKELIKAWQMQGDVPSVNSSLTQLQPGDRLRVRNFLFEIKQAGVTESALRIYRCKGRYAQILHDRLIVYKEANEIDDWTVIDLSNYVEFHQWSAATDLYGFGALCLYTLFSCGLQRQSQTSKLANGRNPDTLFMEMMEILESIPYFKFFWEELETFRQMVEMHFKQMPQASHQYAADIPVLRTDSLDGETLYDMALHATNNILQSTPKARIILEQFKFNFAHFLLFIHFVLACLHRESHMPSHQKGSMTPFAKDRTEFPVEGGAASLALQRLIEIKGYLSQPFFDGFKRREASEILDFNPRSDFQLRIELENLKDEISGLESSPLAGVFSLHPRLKKLVEKAKKKDEPEKENISSSNR